LHRFFLLCLRLVSSLSLLGDEPGSLVTKMKARQQSFVVLITKI
jgi:hypothetical protein